MLDHVQIAGPPSAYDSIAWSQDGELAVATGESVDILAPRRSFKNIREQLTAIEQWHRLKVQVNLFTVLELPYEHALPFEDFSIGEEQSAGHVLSLQWSPEGIGRHGHCMLAVLTSNLVLSIWDARKDRHRAGNWYRTRIVNDVLRKHHSDSQGTEKGVGQVARVARLKTRIRSFAWSNSFPFLDEDLRSTNGYASSLLAVSDDTGSISILRVALRTHSGLSTTGNWDCTVLQCIDCLKPWLDSTLGKDSGHQFSKSTEIVRRLTWNEWSDKTDHESTRCSISLAYSFGPSVQICRVGFRWNSGGTSVEASISYDLLADARIGPVLWSPTIHHDEQVLLVFTHTNLLRYSNLMMPSSRFRLSAVPLQPLEDKWDAISTCDFTYGPQDTSQPLLLYTTHQTDTQEALVARAWPSMKSVDLPWRTDIDQLAVRWSEEFRAKDFVMNKVWGIQTHPLGTLTAMCVTPHPKGLISYLTSSNIRTYVGITNVMAPLPNVTGRRLGKEAIQFMSTVWASSNIRSDQPTSSITNELRIFLREALSDKTRPVSLDEISMTREPRMIVKLLRSRLPVKENFMRLVLGTLGQPESDVTNANRGNVSTSPALADVISSLLAFDRSALKFRSFDQHVLHNYEAAKALLGKDNSPDVHVRGGAITASEDCEICREPIPFERLEWSRCSTGHEFLRCSVTFMSIQEPGISKTCGLCESVTLADQYLMERLRGGEDEVVGDSSDLELHTGEDRDGRPHFVELLMTAFDTCMNCGGKYL